jgi:hypothetical protein
MPSSPIIIIIFYGENPPYQFLTFHNLFDYCRVLLRIYNNNFRDWKG